MAKNFFTSIKTFSFAIFAIFMFDVFYFRTSKAEASISRVSVHDPSIVIDSSGVKKKYYVFGSHCAAAMSYDLVNWSNFEWKYGIINSQNRLVYSNYKSAFLTNQTKSVTVLVGNDTVVADFGNFDANQWRYTINNPDLAGNQWAPDVIWNPYMNKWCMYMSLNGDDWRSAIVLLTADQLKGPFLYQGPVVFSGFQWTDLIDQTWKQTDLPLVLGDVSSLPSRYMIGKSWGNRWPNCIDPCVFFDDGGQLWMSYGSWSGGIFMLKIDRTNGLRDYTSTYKLVGSGNNVTQDPYFGKKIAGGNYVSGEGSYIKKIGRYYYLFISYGGLNSDGGYEMRYFRSSSPNGEYKDGDNNNAIFNSYCMNYGPSLGSKAGNRIFGPYKWPTMSDAEISQGHNSVLLDSDGRVFLIYHTRFADAGENHQLRVHQLFQNSSGWLVASPYEFADCKYNQDSIDSRRICSDSDIVGTYQFILHPYGLDYKTKSFQSAEDTHLNPDGTVSGSYVGTWSVAYKDKSYITLKIAKRTTETKVLYSGIAIPQAVNEIGKRPVCLSLISQGGVPVWGTKINDIPDDICKVAVYGQSDGSMYGINGTKLMDYSDISGKKLPKGIYIIKGKKVLIK